MSHSLGELWDRTKANTHTKGTQGVAFIGMPSEHSQIYLRVVHSPNTFISRLTIRYISHDTPRTLMSMTRKFVCLEILYFNAYLHAESSSYWFFILNFFIKIDIHTFLSFSLHFVPTSNKYLLKNKETNKRLSFDLKHSSNQELMYIYIYIYIYNTHAHFSLVSKDCIWKYEMNVPGLLLLLLLRKFRVSHVFLLLYILQLLITKWTSWISQGFSVQMMWKK